jgi:predicted nucleic acid-binding Zn ribbon protein
MELSQHRQKNPLTLFTFIRYSALACPHCQARVPESASVCTGCGAEIVRGLSRRERSFVGLVFIGIAIFAFVMFLQAFEIARGVPFLTSPKAEDGPWVIVAFIAVILLPYLIGTRLARFLWRSRVRFFRSYQHQ